MSLGWLYITIAAAAGVAAGLQVIVNSQLNKTVDLFLTTLVVNLVASVVILSLYILFGRDGFQELRQAPSWTYLGGILGVIVVMGGTFVVPKLGVGGTSVVFIFSQLLFAMWADHFGLLGIKPFPVNIYKVTGVGLMMAGIFLFFLKKG